MAGAPTGTVAIVERLKSEFPNLQVIHNPKRLQAAAMNLAVAEHQHTWTRYIVRCDAHSIYPAGFILSVAGHFNQQGARLSSSRWMRSATRASNAQTPGSSTRRSARAALCIAAARFLAMSTMGIMPVSTSNVSSGRRLRRDLLAQ
jgi:hypothetical protein